MKDKLISALTSEYEAVYLINLEDDTYENLKTLRNSPAMLSSKHWSEAGKDFVEECAEESKTTIELFSDPQFLRRSLLEADRQECTFRHAASDSRRRRIVAHVIERSDNIPKLVLMTVTTSDKLFDGIKILLVEDNELLRMISRETLENEGAVITEAEDGLQAVELVTAGNKYDFIIMDIVMPVLDGVSATRKITEYQKELETEIPILGLTADASDEQMKEIIDAGAYACLAKPLDTKEMSKVFISCMKEKSLQMEEKMAEINLMANTDMLTQSGNIVAYTRDIGYLSRELYECSTDVAIVVCDLDNLKGINDNYGHDVGDKYIKNCSKLITETFKDSPLYRIGGDEFALILRDKSISEIDACMKTLNDQSIKRYAIKNVVDGKASVAAGYAIYDTDIDQSLADTMKRADMAMYENKLKHRNYWL